MQQNFNVSELSDECIVVLTDEERSAVEAMVNQLPPLDDQHLNEDSTFTHISIAKKDVPCRLAAKLIEFRRSSNACGTLLLRNLPIDGVLPPTPQDDSSAICKTHVSEAVLLSMMMYFGEPIAYEDEKGGAIIHNVFPVPGKEERQENTSSVFFDFHTENSFHPHKPDYLGLLCLRSDHEQTARTTAASIRTALGRVPGKLIPLLRQPFYRIRVASSFMGNGKSPILYSPLLPILSGDLAEPDLCINFYNTEAINPAAQLAFDALKSALLQVVVGIVLLPGDLLIIDNRVAVHGRTAFESRYDGSDRWLQRLFVVEDFRRSHASRRRGSHVCIPLGAELFSLQGNFPAVHSEGVPVFTTSL
ncbi:MAG: TauD/TfdA family dioxygenase [Ktedonobacteraceae bacterium]